MSYPPTEFIMLFALQMVRQNENGKADVVHQQEPDEPGLKLSFLMLGLIMALIYW